MKKAILSFIIFIPLSIIALAMYAMSKENIEFIVINATNEETSYIPSSAYEYYLFNFRLTEEDIKFIESRAGLNFLLGISDQNKKYKFLKYFIAKGVPVNKPSEFDGLPPLHAAILDNDEKLVKFFLNNGADINKKDIKFKFTPEEFIDFLQQKNNTIDRSSIKKIISSSKK